MQLEETAAKFSENAVRGEDPEFGRGTVTYVKRFAGDPSNTPNPVLGPIADAPFHGFRLRFMGTGIGSSGVHTDGDGHVLDETGQPISGRYAVGSCAALTTTGTGYNSGIAPGAGADGCLPGQQRTRRGMRYQLAANAGSQCRQSIQRCLRWLHALDNGRAPGPMKTKADPPVV